MTDNHKAALAKGRADGRVVRDYLEALRMTKPKRGRKRTAESIKTRLAAIDASIESADALTELKLVQERRDLNDELDMMNTAVDVADVESAFVEIAADYGKRQGISHAAWREVGVDAAVLKRAGITRSS